MDINVPHLKLIPVTRTRLETTNSNSSVQIRKRLTEIPCNTLNKKIKIECKAFEPQPTQVNLRTDQTQMEFLYKWFIDR